VVTPCAHIGCAECYTSVIDTVGYCPVCRTDMSSTELVRVRCSAVDEEDDRITASQEELEQFRPSTKLKALVREVEAMPERTKCIIFSQWTSMLDLVELGLRKASKQFARIDGSVPEHMRARVLEEFAQSDGCDVLLLTLKVGGVGLNLTAASYVFLLDPWWNPAVEEQAIDRVHRIGQKKKVVVKRFVIADSVEERIMQLQERKRKLVSVAIGRSEEERRRSRLDDLALLFK